MKHIYKIFLLVFVLTSSYNVHAAIVHFQVALTGFQETDGAGTFDLGDPDGFGVADLIIDTDTDTLEWDIMTANISNIEGAHIHKGAFGTNGPVVVNFPGLSGQVSGLFDSDLLDAIVTDPLDYYVNIHTCEFPAGAIRGQLGTPLTVIPVPAAAWLFGSGLLGLLGIARNRTT